MFYKGAVTNDEKETELSHNLNQQIRLFIYLLITVL